MSKEDLTEAVQSTNPLGLEREAFCQLYNQYDMDDEGHFVEDLWEDKYIEFATGYRSATAHYQPLLDAKDGEIATLKALLEQAREGLEKIENDLIGLGAQDELTYQYPDKAGSLDWLYRYTRDTLAAINAATGEK